MPLAERIIAILLNFLSLSPGFEALPILKQKNIYILFESTSMILNISKKFGSHYAIAFFLTPKRLIVMNY